MCPRPRRNTVAMIPCINLNSDISHNGIPRDDIDQISPEIFQLTREKYPFTFKHMIHKLYNKDAWAQTVKEVLERSKKDFKPLADKAIQESQVRNDLHMQNTARRKSTMTLPGLGAAKRASVMTKGNRSRRFSQAVKYDMKAPLSPIICKDPHISSNQSPSNGESIRALKKRCVGVRKSISGIPGNFLDGDMGSKDDIKNGGSFVYASNVSSVEGPAREVYICFPQVSPVSPSESCFSRSGDGSSCYEQINSPSTPSTPTSQRMKRRVSVDNKVVTLNSLPLQVSRNVEKVMTWRHSLMNNMKWEIEDEEANMATVIRQAQYFTMYSTI